MIYTHKAATDDIIAATHSFKDFSCFILLLFFFFSVHKNVKNILALNDTIFPFPDRWVFMCDLMGFKFSDLLLRNKLCVLEKS